MQKQTGFINQESISKCLEYVDKENQQEFINLVNSLKISTRLIDRTQNYFDDNDKMVRNIYSISVTRNGKNIRFTFGDSQANTLEGKEPELYDILTVISAEYDFNDYSFEEFCDEFGYDTDSRKTEKLFNKWKKHNEKLKQIFDDEDIQVLPH